MNDRASKAPPQRLIRSFHVMVKPVGAQCNLDCGYCYYLHKSELLSDVAPGRIADDLLEEFVRQYIGGQDTNTVVFSWHGGEPTLAGLDFYEKVVALQQRYAGTKRIENDLQTNGLLLDDSWCSFFKKHGFLIGISIDGPKDLHDRFRRNRHGGPSFEQVCRAIRLLQQHGVSFNTLTVINSETARYPTEIYEFLTRELGSRRLQWLPCVERKDFCTTAPGHWNAAEMPILGTSAAKPGYADSIVTDWTVDADDWGNFLCQTFDQWLKRDFGNVRVSWFDSLIGQWMNKPPQVCVLADVCGRGLVMDQDGSLYSCDHFVYPEYRIGNLRDKDCQLVDMVYSPEQRKFGCRKRDNLLTCCKECPYGFACNGGCLKDRFIKTLDGQPGLNYLCSGIKRFLTYADPHLQHIVARIQGEVGRVV